MRYLALACDYDGTIAHHGRVDEPTRAALERVVASGRRLVLVTGRELEDLQTVYPHLGVFEWVVAENGALLYRPATKESKQLAPPAPEPFIRELRRRGVTPLSVGHAIVATWEPHETTVLAAIRDLGLELQVIFNKGAVMVLPASVNKATGLAAALAEMGLSAHNVVGVGDAENDHAFLSICECSAAVANALPTVKEEVAIVTRGDHGTGVAELIGELLADDLRAHEGKLTRHHLLLGIDESGEEVRVPPYGNSLLVAGPSASGKSTVVTALLERLAEKKYQFCVIDPEGDYGNLTPAIHLGAPERAPSVEEILDVLHVPDQNVTVNLLGLPLNERPHFFQELLPRLQERRARTGRPHWLVIDEAHHLLPTGWQPASQTIAQALDQVLLVTVHPDEVSPAVLRSVRTLVAVGQSARDTFARFCNVVQHRAPVVPTDQLDQGELLLWQPDGNRPPFRVRLQPGKTERRRHSRKYAEGELPPARSFYFRGRERKLNLRAQNLFLFLQIADGVDDDTWAHHLRQGDYSRWAREGVKDETLAAEFQRIEVDHAADSRQSRARVRAAIERYYTLPASTPGLKREE